MKMEKQHLIPELNQLLDLTLPETPDREELQEILAIYINELIQNDFPKLIRLLYRIDIHEQQLKSLLQKTEGKDAGSLIAGLIIDRQLQKIQYRNEFRTDDDIPDDERW